MLPLPCLLTHHFWYKIHHFNYRIHHFKWKCIHHFNTATGCVPLQNSSFLMHNSSLFNAQFLVFDTKVLVLIQHPSCLLTWIWVRLRVVHRETREVICNQHIILGPEAGRSLDPLISVEPVKSDQISRKTFGNQSKISRKTVEKQSKVALRWVECWRRVGLCEALAIIKSSFC